jgi:hypothetical protein
MFPNSPPPSDLGTGPGSSSSPASKLSPADPTEHLTSQAERQVMHPLSGAALYDPHDPDWRYYHGAIGG